VDRLLRPATAWALASLVLVLSAALILPALTAGQNPLVTAGVVSQALEPAHVTVWTVRDS
jgi:hypothetical protein